MQMEFPDIPEQDWIIVENDIEWTIDEENIPWEGDPHMALPEGVKTYTVNTNEAEGRADFYIRFPEGTSSRSTLTLHPTPS